MRFSRRTITRLLAGAPVAAAAAGLLRGGSVLGPETASAAGQEPEPQATPTEPGETPLGKFLAKEAPDLTSEEKRRVRKQVAGLEQSLKEVRAYVLGNDVPPADIFRALRSARPRSDR